MRYSSLRNFDPSDTFSAVSLSFSGTNLIQTTNAKRLEDSLFLCRFRCRSSDCHLIFLAWTMITFSESTSETTRFAPLDMLRYSKKTRKLVDIQLILPFIEPLFRAKFCPTDSSIPFERSDLLCESFTVADEDSTRTHSMSIDSDADWFFSFSFFN